MDGKKLTKDDIQIWEWYVRTYLTANEIPSITAHKNKDVIDFDQEIKNIKPQKPKKKKVPTYSKVFDLHGMTRDEAYKYLEVQLCVAKMQNIKCILVITGKGHGKGEGLGILKRKMPLWLESPKFSSIVKQYQQASRQDGGEGALYVFLR